MPNLKRILVPVDFSPCSRAALDRAADLAGHFGASIHVLHCWEVPAYLRPDLTVWSGEVSATLAEHAEREARRAMEQFLEESGVAARSVVTSELLSGAPYTVISAALEARGYDLVVLGTHGRSGLAHLVLGSVAERVVRHSRVPVLTVRGAG
ncbi:MAG: universal stress protein [Deltaproteobacteria bacterium]|nr:universal stress protein [Deltaproteobacteria bacterium]